MRILVAALAMVMVMGATAWAATSKSAYDDVPTDHWAYNALDYLTEKGVLEGYPGGFFKGDRTLTRYEFAQAVARLLDTMEQGGGDENVKVMVDSLRAEFSDQLAAQQKTIDALNATTTDNTNRVNDMESMVNDHGARLSALEDKVKNFKSGPDWKGTFRYRWRFDKFDNAAGNTRFRQQVIFKLGYAQQINDVVQVGFRLGTQTGATNGLVPAFNLGGGGAAGAFNTPQVFLDQAYVKYTPKWFGFYTQPGCDQKCSPKLDLWAGIIPNLTHDSNNMILDRDINLQGTAFVYHFNKNFQLTGISGAVVENNSDVRFGASGPIPAIGLNGNTDTYFWGLELVHNNILMCGLDAWVGAYGWTNEGNLERGYGAAGFDPFFDNGFVHTAPGFAPGGTAGTTQRLTNSISNSFFTVKGGAQYTFKEVLNKPFAVFGEYMVNTQATGTGGGANLRFAPNTNVPLLAANDDIGWVVGAQWGPIPTEPGQWYWAARYKEVGSEAIIDGFGDSDAGGANVNSLEFTVATMIYKNSMFGITYWIDKMHNAYGYSIPAGKEDLQTLCVDYTFKF